MLELKLINKENPYSDEPSAPFDLWVEFTLKYEDKILLSTQWDMVGFIEWFIEKKEYLATEVFPFEFLGSIAESRDLLFDKITDFSDEQENEMFDYIDYLSDYFVNHYFHLRGTDTQSFYIGLIPNLNGEISCSMEDKYERYEFNMDNFISSVDQEIKKLLKICHISNETKSFFEESLSYYYKYVGSVGEKTNEESIRRIN